MFATDANVAVAVAVAVDVSVSVAVVVGWPTCRYFGLPRIVSCLCVVLCCVILMCSVVGWAVYWIG